MKKKHTHARTKRVGRFSTDHFFSDRPTEKDREKQKERDNSLAVVPVELVVHVRKIVVVRVDELVPLHVRHLDHLALELNAQEFNVVSSRQWTKKTKRKQEVVFNTVR